jgi:NADP-dependent 3-hydroxy acid dehydrogenase YdfG
MSSTRATESTGDRLDGATGVVTGASRGIGLAIATTLVAHGARVALIARGASSLHEAAESLGVAAIPIVCDVSDGIEVDAAVRRIRAEFGGAPTIVVNNAGAFTLAPVEATDPISFAEALDTNLVAPLRFMRAFLADMRARAAGHLITIGSIADRHAFPGNGAYAASKFGMRALHEVLRLETRGSGVRATLISPGPVDTSLWDPIDPDNRAGFTPRSQMLDVHAVAAAVIYSVAQPPHVTVDELRLSRS